MSAFLRITNPSIVVRDYKSRTGGPGTETYGRGKFFIHGGKTPGSAGCIDLTVWDVKFFRKLIDVNQNRKNKIPLTVRYYIN